MTSEQLRQRYADIREKHFGKHGDLPHIGEGWTSTCETCVLLSVIDTMIYRNWDPKSGGPLYQKLV